jgi:hypothetical protein
MQDYILHHTERVDKFKLALWNLCLEKKNRHFEWTFDVNR